MKNLTTLLFVTLCLLCTASCSEEEECPIKEYPFEIESAEKMTMFIASEKIYPFTDKELTEEELYTSTSCYIYRFAESLNWEFCPWVITDFDYEKGHEYKIEGWRLDYRSGIDGKLTSLFQCCNIKSKQEKKSILLPEPQPVTPPQEPEVKTLYVASEKRRHPSMKAEEDIYSSPWGYMVSYVPDQTWTLFSAPIYDFEYEKGYEYHIEALVTYRWTSDDTYEEDEAFWQKTVSKVKKDSLQE